MNVFARSWSLLKSTLAVLSAEKSFLAYPLLAGFFILLFSVLILGGGAFLAATQPQAEQALVALGRLVERLGAEQNEQQLRFQERFPRFATVENRKRVRALFGKRGRPA